MKSPSCPPAFLDVLLLLIGSILVLEPRFDERTEALDLDLPNSASQSSPLVLDESDLRIELAEDGNVRIDSQALPATEFAAALSRALAAGKSQAVVHGHRLASYEVAMQLVDALQAAGFRSIRFAVQAQPSQESN